MRAESIYQMAGFTNRYRGYNNTRLTRGAGPALATFSERSKILPQPPPRTSRGEQESILCSRLKKRCSRSVSLARAPLLCRRRLIGTHTTRSLPRSCTSVFFTFRPRSNFSPFGRFFTSKKISALRADLYLQKNFRPSGGLIN